MPVVVKFLMNLLLLITIISSTSTMALSFATAGRTSYTTIHRRERLGGLLISAVVDAIVFALELTSLALTVAHFLHIWSLHGLSFGLVDCVLALHLHTAIAAAGKKIALRRNLNKIHRDLNGYFSDATELDMRKAHQAGDVCCICLGTMSTSNVKKVPCGHLYHTHCLKEVVERARSIHAARCPLCRASLVPETNDSNNATVVPVNQENVVPENNAPVIPQPMNGNGGEHTTTENDNAEDEQ